MSTDERPPSTAGAMALVGVLVGQLFGGATGRRIKAATATAEALDLRLAELERSLRGVQEQLSGEVEEQAAWRERMEADQRALNDQFTKFTRSVADLTQKLDDSKGRRGVGDGEAAPAAGPRSGLLDLVTGLREEASRLFAPAPETADTATPRIAVDGLEVEIKGDLDLTDGVGLRAYSPDRASPEAASTIRFSLRPEVRVVPPAEETP